MVKIHGGSSGIGTFAIQIAKYLGIKVFVTAGSEEKLAACKVLGADVCINYRTKDFVERIKQETNGKGVDVIRDNIGGSYLQRNLNNLGVDGRLFIIGFQGGIAAEVNLQAVLARRLTIQATGLRNRSLAKKAEIVSEVEKNVWPAVAAGKVKPMIYKTFPLCEAAEAHRLMEASTHIGKILLLPLHLWRLRSYSRRSQFKNICNFCDSLHGCCTGVACLFYISCSTRLDLLPREIILSIGSLKC
ncbi:quinone oxidoreductase PIG3 [Zea mays]|uniref:quinone oxidoreductase PIG3 n=1 Tax=Zea mays TaxID=4577 RepID=UPI000C6C8242|nr:quinone oxidoreductase PIG3 [Zea mays]|eukprot:XP_023156452.1 quinone oxidoreductase PIG3-like [Zea mays]